MGVPMKLHLVAGRQGRLVVIVDGKTEGSRLFLFLIIYIFHNGQYTYILSLYILSSKKVNIVLFFLNITLFLLNSNQYNKVKNKRNVSLRL